VVLLADIIGTVVTRSVRVIWRRYEFQDRFSPVILWQFPHANLMCRMSIRM
jgi:hypothetical protein